VAPAFWSALFFAFLIAFDDLVVGHFFSTADSYTLAMRMWDDIRLEISPRIAAVAVVFFSAAILLFLIVRAASLVRRDFQRKVSRHAAAQDY
jgi:putative spermidine/putrescine transport system permease protein